MPSVYDLGKQPPSTKPSSAFLAPRSLEEDDYRSLCIHPQLISLSKDRFDEGSVSFDDYGKGGIYQEESVLSDSAVVDDVAESDGNRSGDDIEDEVGIQSKPKVFEFSGLRSKVVPISSHIPQESEISLPQTLRETWILIALLRILQSRTMRKSPLRSPMSMVTVLRATSTHTHQRKK